MLLGAGEKRRLCKIEPNFSFFNSSLAVNVYTTFALHEGCLRTHPAFVVKRQMRSVGVLFVAFSFSASDGLSFAQRVPLGLYKFNIATGRMFAAVFSSSLAAFACFKPSRRSQIDTFETAEHSALTCTPNLERVAVRLQFSRSTFSRFQNKDSPAALDRMVFMDLPRLNSFEYRLYSFAARRQQNSENWARTDSEFAFAWLIASD
jgi:hypothetical protein